MLGPILNTHGEVGLVALGPDFIIQQACSTRHEMTSLPSTAWEGLSLKTRHIHALSIHHLENLNALLFKQEILSAD